MITYTTHLKVLVDHQSAHNVESNFKHMKILSIILSLITLSSFSQTYSSLSFSTSSTDDIRLGSYLSCEVGRSWENLSLGLVVGSSDLNFYQYWWEAKTSISFPLGKRSGYLLGGFGNYFGTDRTFIEYGIGFMNPINKRLGIFIQGSSWDEKLYLSVGPTLTL